jgi:XTP/dITP diphosphohydrolase
MKPLLILASRNPGKIRELRSLLSDLPVDLLDLRDFPAAPEVPEEGATYLENARHKALTVARFANQPALGEDSGLEVDALDGAPGIRSARFARAGATDGDNIQLLLDCMRDVPAERRTARFRCTIVVARPDGRLLTREGSCEGLITSPPRGDKGFGYDPVFYHPPSRCNLAELSEEAKALISHRAAACALLRQELVAFLSAR